MTLELARLLLDFGLMVLIWMVQLVVYPGLCHYKSADLGRWHKLYTGRIGVIVGPLMIAQLVVAGFQLYEDANIYTFGSIAIIILIWILTFLIFVPLHNAIDPSNSCKDITESLVQKNWWRTFLWTFLFLASLAVKISDYNFQA